MLKKENGMEVEVRNENTEINENLEENEEVNPVDMLTSNEVIDALKMFDSTMLV